MFYRVVLQGRAAGNQDMDTVKREFARVTGMPENVTERLFARTPQPLKERVSQADADRIAATLRAIGAAVTVERDLLASLEAADGGVHEIVPPGHRGPPTVVPGSEPTPAAPPTAAQRLLRRLRPYLPLLIGAPIACVLLVVAAPYADEAIRALRPAPAALPEPVKPRPAQAPAPALPRSASLLHGPWRCTDQRTGMATYWTLGADGTLTYHGETFKERATSADDLSIPVGWQFADDRLVFTYTQQPPQSYAVSDLNLTRLRYGDGRDFDIQCRRP
jgi:hypothetical protein